MLLVLIIIIYLILLDELSMSSAQRRFGPFNIGILGLLASIINGINLIIIQSFFIMSSYSFIMYLGPLIFLFILLLFFLLLLPMFIIDLLFIYFMIILLSSILVFVYFLLSYSSFSKYSIIGSFRIVTQFISFSLIFDTILTIFLYVSSFLSFSLFSLLIFSSISYTFFHFISFVNYCYVAHSYILFNYFYLLYLHCSLNYSFNFLFHFSSLCPFVKVVIPLNLDFYSFFLFLFIIPLFTYIGIIIFLTSLNRLFFIEYSGISIISFTSYYSISFTSYTQLVHFILLFFILSNFSFIKSLYTFKFFYLCTLLFICIYIGCFLQFYLDLWSSLFFSLIILLIYCISLFFLLYFLFSFSLRFLIYFIPFPHKYWLVVKKGYFPMTSLSLPFYLIATLFISPFFYGIFELLFFVVYFPIVTSFTFSSIGFLPFNPFFYYNFYFWLSIYFLILNHYFPIEFLFVRYISFLLSSFFCIIAFPIGCLCYRYIHFYCNSFCTIVHSLFFLRYFPIVICNFFYLIFTFLFHNLSFLHSLSFFLYYLPSSSLQSFWSISFSFSSLLQVYCVPLFLFITFNLCILVESNRVPFDLPEAESELVAGFMTEFSSLYFSIIILSEYFSLIIFVLFMIILYNLNILLLLIILLIYCICRATLNRLKYDELLSFGWYFLLIITFSYFILLIF